MFDFLENEDGPESFRKRILKRLRKNEHDYVNYYLLSVIKSDDSSAKKSKMLAKTSSQSIDKFDKMPIEMLMQQMQNMFGDISMMKVELAKDEEKEEEEKIIESDKMMLIDVENDIIRCPHCESEYDWNAVINNTQCPVCGEFFTQSDKDN